MVFSAAAVSMIINNKPSAVEKLKSVPTPARRHPTTVMTTPTMIAFTTLAALSPRTSSALVMGVTR